MAIFNSYVSLPEGNHYDYQMVISTLHWQGTIPASSTVMALGQRMGSPGSVPGVRETCRCSQKKSQRSSVANLKETEKSENLEIWCKCQKISWFHMLRHLVRLLHTSQAGAVRPWDAHGSLDLEVDLRSGDSRCHQRFPDPGNLGDKCGKTHWCSGNQG